MLNNICVPSFFNAVCIVLYLMSLIQNSTMAMILDNIMYDKHYIKCSNTIFLLFIGQQQYQYLPENVPYLIFL